MHISMSESQKVTAKIYKSRFLLPEGMRAQAVAPQTANVPWQRTGGGLPSESLCTCIWESPSGWGHGWFGMDWACSKRKAVRPECPLQDGWKIDQVAWRITDSEWEIPRHTWLVSSWPSNSWGLNTKYGCVEWIAWALALLDLLHTQKTFPQISICAQGKGPFWRWVKRSLATKLSSPMAASKGRLELNV